MTVVTLSDGILTVDIEEVQENRAATPVALEPTPDVTGTLVIYERHNALRDLSISGRVKSKAEAERLEGFLSKELTVTERDGTLTTGWRIRTDPPPSIRRKDGDSPDYSVEFKLWRLP